MPMPEEKFRVAIIGGGIAGLALACALGKLDTDRKIEVDIYEASTKLSEIGAGINIWPRTWEILQHIGLDKELASLLPRYPDDTPELVFHLRKGDQPDGFPIKDLIWSGGTVRFHRADLQRVMLKNVPSHHHIHLSHRLNSYIQREDSVEIQFKNGYTKYVDILVGADGYQSATRKIFLASLGDPAILQKCADPQWSGCICYRGLVSVDDLEKEMPRHRSETIPVMYIGKSKKVITYPISQGKFINVAMAVMETENEGAIYAGDLVVMAPQEEMLSKFVHWDEEVQALLRCIKEPSRRPLLSLNPLPCFAKGRVMLIGDAAHAMLPHLAVGAGQGIEDAYIFASLLSHPKCNARSIARILEIFDHVRRPAATRIAEASSFQGKLAQFNIARFDDVKEGDYVSEQRLHDLADDMANEWKWVWTTSAEEDRSLALMQL